MAKKNIDPFEKFREATLGGGSLLGEALSSTKPSPVSPRESIPAHKKASKNENRTLKSFHVDNDLFRLLGQVKYETGASYDTLYNEAIHDLLVKYGKM